jgi:L-alanine-DL-glutamate epimerase-like enolase superfamily enzyme
MDLRKKFGFRPISTNNIFHFQFKLLWIEEPTSPDDVVGHGKIAEALKKRGIATGVATGEQCCNRVLFKQFLQTGSIEYCQIDSARIGGVNEILSVYLMAKKFNVKVCPHAGGVGLCEMVQVSLLLKFHCCLPFDQISNLTIFIILVPASSILGLHFFIRYQRGKIYRIR